VLLILVVAWPILRPQDVAPVAPVATGPAAIDLNSMTPIEAADRLYARVMAAAEVGDSATVVTFMPMAIQSYERAAPLNEDGLFHLSSLQRTAGDFTTAIATAEEGLDRNPNHLLLLYAAGEAAALEGMAGEARDYYQRLLDAYDAEMASGNLDYEAHVNMMGNVRSTALTFLGGGG
jgi:tetratricopeptide (TPR) repeat protein